MPKELKEINIEDILIEAPEVAQEGVALYADLLIRGLPVEPIDVSYCRHDNVLLLLNGTHRLAARYFFMGQKTIMAEVEPCTDIFPCIGYPDHKEGLYSVKDIQMVDFNLELAEGNEKMDEVHRTFSEYL